MNITLPIMGGWHHPGAAYVRRIRKVFTGGTRAAPKGWKPGQTNSFPGVRPAIAAFAERADNHDKALRAYEGYELNSIAQHGLPCRNLNPLDVTGLSESHCFNGLALC